jgi:hypothetical protein
LTKEVSLKSLIESSSTISNEAKLKNGKKTIMSKKNFLMIAPKRPKLWFIIAILHEFLTHFRYNPEILYKQDKF